MMKLLKTDFVFFGIYLSLIILTIIFRIYPDLATPITIGSISTSFSSFETTLTVVFLVCIIGNLLPIPTPYLLITSLGAIQFGTNLLSLSIIALVGASGALIGEVFSYYLGRLIGLYWEKKPTNLQFQQNLNYISQILKQYPRSAPLLVFLFGLTPLNDDLILVPLGLLGYSPKKTIFFCWLGKLGLMAILAFLPNIIPEAFLVSKYSFFTTMLPLIGIVILVHLFVRVNWIQIIQKIFSKLGIDIPKTE